MKLSAASSSSLSKAGVVTLALLAGPGAFAANPATVTGIDQSSITDTTTTGLFQGTAISRTVNVDKYVGSGVLIGVTGTASFGTESVQFTNTSSSGSNKTKTASAYTSGTLDIGGLSGSGSSAGTGNVTIATNLGTSTVNSAAYSYTTTTALTQTILDNFYGGTTGTPGTVSATLTERANLSLSSNPSGNAGMSANYASHNATVTANYTAVNHANGSLSSSGDTSTLNLNFGDIANGAYATGDQTFNLYNLLGSFGLQVKSITQTAGTGVFGLSGAVTSASNFAGGSFASGAVNFIAQTVAGLYNGSWTIKVADTAAGIAAGRNTTLTDTLTVNATANVLKAVTPVPEPETYSMMFAGLALMGAVVRRRTNKKA